ncbi:MAG: hypothetical protein K8R48_03220 [Alphaproteobacteria bacterium]|nr:hypothetical protein [Alphaproteobacteria bacterium]
MNFFTKLKKRLQWARTPDQEKQQLLEKAVTLLHFDPDALELFRMAQADGVEIKFSSGLTGSRTAARHVLNFNKKKQYIEICPYTGSGRLKTPVMIASDLVHELRHYWQYKQLGVTPQNGNHINRNPRLSFVFNRVAEADAYAFQDKFIKTMNETSDVFSEFLKEIPAPTPLQAHQINYEANKKFQKLRANDAQYLRERFVEMLKKGVLSQSYDPQEARYLHLRHTSSLAEKTDFDAVKHIPELTLADIKKVLKAGVVKNAPGYLGDMSDDQFEDLVLGNAHRGALEAVNLMEKFSRAVAGNDNKTAKELRRQVKEKIHKLK